MMHEINEEIQMVLCSSLHSLFSRTVRLSRRVVNVCCGVYQGHDLFGYRDWGLDVDALPGIAATPGLSLCALLYALSQNERKRSE